MTCVAFAVALATSAVTAPASRGSATLATLLAPVLGCGDLRTFEPRSTDAYLDYPVNGELAALQYRSYLHTRFIPVVRDAADGVRRLADGWTSGHGAPIGLGDMSECDGSAPGTSVGNPGHPPGTHIGGTDIDIAYYQAGTPDNRLRAVCDSRQGGNDEHRCVGPPKNLDAPRTALLVEAMAASGFVRVVGVDGRIGPILEGELERLCEKGISDCTPVPLAYEATDTGLGWFRNHHHHMHVSFLEPGGSSDTTPPETTVDSGPKKVKKPRAKFGFSSSEPGSSFECRLDQSAFKPCTSPRRVNGLKLGQHKFFVRAIDAAGNIDPTPAKRRFTVALSD